MSVNVLETLQQYENAGKTAIDIPQAISAQFGAAIGTAIQQILTGSISVNGATFALTGNAATATVSGTGSAAPLLSEMQVSVTFTADGQGNVSMTLTGGFTSSVPISSAWPQALNEWPFTELSLSQGSLSLNVAKASDTSVSLTASATGSYSGSVLGTGLLVVNYAGSLGYLAGFIVTRTGSPFSNWPVLSSLSLQGEGGAFLSTITQTDLSAFSSLNLPYLPDSISPGLTFLGSLLLTGTLEPLTNILPTGTTFDLLANTALGSSPASSVTATLALPQTNASFQFNKFDLEWKTTGTGNGSISISADARLTVPSGSGGGDTQLAIDGIGTLAYGSNPSIGVSLTVSAQGGNWQPFGIPNLTIIQFGIGFTLADEVFSVTMQGTIEIGVIGGGGQPVLLTVGLGIADFEFPDYVQASLSAANPGAQVTLAQLVDDFIPSLDLSHFPLLNDISFGSLTFLAVAAPSTIGGKTYNPGIGATGDIQFYGYGLDFAFTLTTSPQTAIQAKGTLGKVNGTNPLGPIVISAAGINLITISDATGKLGPSACIDTTGSGFCGNSGGSGNYFSFTAGISLLGLISSSVSAAASASQFNFAMSLGASSIFSESLACSFLPSSNDFAAAAYMSFTPGSISFGGWGPIPSFSISGPDITLALALGTVVPTTSPFPNGWLPSSAPYFFFELTFSWGISFDIKVSLDLNAVVTAFTDFASFVLHWVESNAEAIFKNIITDVEEVAKLLLKIGQDFYTVLKTVASYFALAYQDAFDIVQKAFEALFGDVCGVSTANAALPPPSGSLSASSIVMGQAAVSDRLGVEMSSVLADLAAGGADGRGQELLYHYYLNRDEWESRLRPGTSLGDRCRELLVTWQRRPELAAGQYVPLLEDLIRATEAEASEDFRSSAAVVLVTLEPHRNKTYPELLAALG